MARLADLEARLAELEQRVSKLEAPDEKKPAEDDWERSYREHIQQKQAEERAKLSRRTRTGMQSTVSGP